MTKIPLILASPDFGRGSFLVFFYGVLGLPFLLSVASVILAFRRRTGRRSVSGIVVGGISILAAVYFLEIPIWTDPVTYLTYSPFVLGAVGITISARKKMPNQPQQTTIGNSAPDRV